MVTLEESSLVLILSKKYLNDLKNILRVTGMFFIYLILYILLFKYFAENFEGFFALKFPPSNTGTKIWTSWLSFANFQLLVYIMV